MKKQLTPEEHDALRETPDYKTPQLTEEQIQYTKDNVKPRTWRDPYNHHETTKTVEHNYLPSLTIPNDSFSLKELLDRNQRGLPLTTSGRTELYHGDEEMPDLQKMDISEIHDLAEANRDKIRSYHDLQKREAENAVAAKERKLKALEDEVNQYRSKYPKTPETTNP